MDGDDFSRARRLGRMAAEAIREAVANDVPFDAFTTGQLIDRSVAHAGTLRTPTLRPAKEVDRDLFAATR